MKISIVIPSYNQGRFLETTLLSIFDQNYNNLEIIVMDGGSTDGSKEIIKHYADQLYFWQSKPDNGQSSAIYEGFNLARGEIIGWLNSDDILIPGTLKRIKSAVLRYGSPNAVFFGGHQVIDINGTVQEVYFPTNFYSQIARKIGPTICQPGTFFGREVYFKVDGIDTSLQYGMDLDLWFKFLREGIPFVKIGAIQAGFRRHPHQKGHSRAFLKICSTEGRLLNQKYGVTQFSKMEKKRALRRLQIVKLMNGSWIRTLLFRLIKHGRFKEFQTFYT